MEKSQRPPQIQLDTGAAGDETPMERESSLLPGMLRTPSVYYGDKLDWGAPGSTVWEQDVPAQQQPQQTVQTPLTGYGHSSEVWASATATSLLPEDGAENDVAEPTESGDSAAHTATQSQAATMAAAALRALGPDALPSPPLGPHPPMFSTNASATAVAGHRSPAATVHHPYAVNPSFFTVQESDPSPSYAAPMARPYTVPPTDLGPGGVVVTEHRGHAGRGGHGAHAAASTLPTLEDKQVAQSIIASAGLPLSMGSLVEYIKEGQPQFQENSVGGLESAIYGTTRAHRNYPNLSEPPPQQAPTPVSMPVGMQRGGGGYGRGGAMGRGAYSSAAPAMFGHGAGLDMTGRGETGVSDNNWTGVSNDTEAAGGWNVQSNSPGSGPAAPPADMVPSMYAPMLPPQQQQPQQLPSAFTVRGGGPYGANALSGQGSAAFGTAAGRPGRQLVQRGPGPVADDGGFAGQPLQRYGMQAAAHASRPKSESEILSDLLHFHANFFPPPPPPRVPNAQKRARAALWYHYASKWDITHRLPPPPRTPLPEMELEYVLQLPDLTRVPYHGDGWLNMSERWFAVTQSLFDFPDENVGMELDARVVLEQAVTS